MLETVSAAEASNRQITTARWNVMFWEATDPQPQADGSHNYSVRSIAARPDEGFEKWVYVLLLTLDAEDRVMASSLHYEGSYDTEGVLTLVNWADRLGWESPDLRTPTTPAPDGWVPLTLRVSGEPTDAAASSDAASSPRSVYVAFLAHFQLPYDRVVAYTEGAARERLLDRALLLDPALFAPPPAPEPSPQPDVESSDAPDGTEDSDEAPRRTGYGPTARDAFDQGGRGWLTVNRTNTDKPTATAILCDYVDLATDGHHAYEAALAARTVNNDAHAAMLFHAFLSQQVAGSYQASGGNDEVAGAVLSNVVAFHEAADREVVRLASQLYGWQMRLPGFRLAREDAAPNAITDALPEPALNRAEAEAARQSAILEGAGLSEAGRQYLYDEIISADDEWTRLVALAPTALKRAGRIQLVEFREQLKTAVGNVATATTARNARQSTVRDLETRAAGSGQAATDARGRVGQSTVEIDELMGRAADIEARRVRTVYSYLEAVQYARTRAQELAKGVAAATETLDRVELQILDALSQQADDAAKARALAAFSERARDVNLPLPSEVRRAINGVQPMQAWEALRKTLVSDGDVRVSLDLANADRLDLRMIDRGVAVFQSAGTPELVVPSNTVALLNTQGVDLGWKDLAPLREQRAITARERMLMEIRLMLLDQDLLDKKGHVLRVDSERSQSVADIERETGARTAAQQEVEAAEGLQQDALDRLGPARDDAALADEAFSMADGKAEAGARKTATFGKVILAVELASVYMSYKALSQGYTRGTQRRAAGVDFYAAYLDAFEAGSGLGAGVAGSIESLSSVCNSLARKVAEGSAGRLGALRFAGPVAGAFTLVAGALSFDREWRSDDEWGMAGAGLTVLSGGLLTAAFFFTSTGWLAPVGLVLGVLAIGAYLLSDSPLVEWMNTSLWASRRERGTGEGAVRQRALREAQELLRLIAVPVLSVELWEQDPSGGPDTLARYARNASGRTRVPELIRLVVRPGFTPPGWTMELSAVALVLGRERVEVTRPRRVPEQSFDIYLPATGGASAGYLSSYAVGYAVQDASPRSVAVLDGFPAGIQMALRVAPQRLRFECSVTLRPPPDDPTSVGSLTFQVGGNLGYRGLSSVVESVSSVDL